MAAGSTNMLYDAMGRMVEAGGKAVVYGPPGERLGVFSGTTCAAKFALPGGGEALYTNGTLTSLRRKDWLGSSRVSTSWAHAVVSKVAYAPFGETYQTAGSADLDFTGMTQDSVSTLFDFPARKYDPNAGRWTTPDPGGWSVVDPTSPQSYNRYAYVINMPMMLVDPDGLDPCAMAYDDPNCEGDYVSAMQQEQISSQLMSSSCRSSSCSVPGSSDDGPFIAGGSDESAYAAAKAAADAFGNEIFATESQTMMESDWEISN